MFLFSVTPTLVPPEYCGKTANILTKAEKQKIISKKQKPTTIIPIATSAYHGA
jgi:hypothetical protein